MAGFIGDNNEVYNSLNKITGKIRKFIRFGQDYDDMVIDNKIGISPNQAEVIRSGGGDDDDFYFAASYDINAGNNKQIGYFQKNYGSRISYLKSMAKQREITNFLEIISDEAIVSDDDGFFAKANTSLINDIVSNKQDKIKEDLEDNFNHIYTNVFGFKDSTVGWRYFKKFLTEGILAFEIIYNREGDRIIGVSPLDPTQIVPTVEFVGGKRTLMWRLYPDDSNLTKLLPDTHVIYISYGKEGDDDISYVQSLIRSFNLFRTMENTAVIWNIMNSAYRMKMIVPVSGGSRKNQQKIGQLVGRFREDVHVDNDSGEVKINGQPSLNLFRNYAVASKNGQQTEISSIKHDGYDMSNQDLLKYWRDKLWEESRIPYTRLQKDSSSTFISNVDSMERAEVSFGKFVNRLRSDFKEILVKPLYLQMCLDHSMFENDELFRSKVNVKFNKENMFDLYWERENMKKDVDFINSMLGLQDEEEPYFDLDVLIENFTTIDYSILKKNKEAKEAKRKEKEKKEGSENEGGSDETGDNFGLGLGGDEDLDTEVEAGDEGGLDLGGDDEGGLDLGGDDLGGDDEGGGIDLEGL